MGEEVVQEQRKEEVNADEKKEEKVEEKKEEPNPPFPLVLSVNLHCLGCAEKIERSILKIRGVEEVMTDMEKNQVIVKGNVEAQAVCNRIMKRTKRRVEIVSPLVEAEGETTKEVASQGSEMTTVELNVNMHCLACAEQLKRKILKLKGVQTADTEFSSGKVKVTGTMEADKLVEYVYRRTKKQAKIVPKPEPEEPKPEEKKEEEKLAQEEAKPEEKEEEKTREGKEEKAGENREEAMKEGEMMITSDGASMNKLMHYNYYQPLYVIERIPPPQLFSDENPNACCIT